MKELIKELEKMSKRDIENSRGRFFDTVRGETWDKAIGLIRSRIKNETATGGNQVSFDQVVENRIEQIRSVLHKKAKEYASTTDRFHNFRVAARKMNSTPEVALQGMMAKHEVAVLDMINDPGKATIRLIEEKIGDNINYLILLEGLLKERIRS